MQKFKYNASKYAALVPLAFLLMLFLWFFFNWSTIKFRDNLLGFSDKDIFINLFTDNYYGLKATCVVFPLPFAFAINYLLYDEKLVYICRMKNRMQYITECMFHIIIFSFICAFFHEAFSLLFSFVFFGGELISEFHIVKYCLLNFITIFLYFVKVGAVFLLVRTLTNKKIAPYILFVIYFFELYLPEYITWRPVDDANIISSLILENNMATAVIAIIREVCIALVIIILSYFKFQKKDILSNEKK